MARRDFDLVVFGATGYTGSLVAKYLASHTDRPRWAIAGRNAGKLETLGLGVPVLIADATDRASLDAVAARTRVVCTTVGPYAKHGDALVAACAEAGTHYCDLTGELQWHYRMIQANHERAQATGAKLVHSCGYDSIPSDLGTWAAQQAFIAKYGHPAERVTAYYGEASGGLSGGTVASGIGTAREASESKEVRRVLGNPYALDPDPEAVRPAAPDESSIRWDKAMGMYTAPFVMAQYNTRIVRRGHALAGFPWGPDFRYREVMSAPKGPAGLVRAVAFTAGLGAIAFALKRPALREMLAKRVPQPGSGPSEQQRERGHWKARFLAERGDDKLLFVVGDKDGDPGYKSTSKMLGESALCLALDELPGGGGCLTPATAMDGKLLDRLRRAGLTFEEGTLTA